MKQVSKRRITLDEGIEEAAGLLEPDELDPKSEYVRGMTELLARLFPRPDVPTGERAAELFYAIALKWHGFDDPEDVDT